MKSFEEYIQQTDFTLESNKFVVIVGAGFNSEFIKSKDFEMLKNWNCILDWIKLTYQVHFQSSQNLLIDFENIILKQKISQKLLASDVENEISKTIASQIKVKTDDLKETDLDLDVLNIFNNQYISDVINLNFDTVLEENLAKLVGEKFVKNTKSKIANKNNTVFSNVNFKFREINKINFWHPHGNVHQINSLILSSRKYGIQLSKVEKLREKYKSFEVQNMFISKSEDTWVDLLMHRPLLVLGASLNSNEQDILFTIVNRKRNFKNYPASEKPIFQMLEKNNSNLGDWATPIFNHGDYNEQWLRLTQLFTKK
jgi:hypothetical protein